MSIFIIVRLSVNFCFKSLLLLQFIFNHSEFFTGETVHIVPPCNKAGILTFCLEFQKFKEDYLVLFLMCTMLFNYIIPNIRFVNISSHFNVHLPASFLLAVMNSSIHLILETSWNNFNQDINSDHSTISIDLSCLLYNVFLSRIYLLIYMHPGLFYECRENWWRFCCKYWGDYISCRMC